MENQKKERAKDLTLTVLKVVTLMGVVTTAAIMPNAVKMLGSFTHNKKGKNTFKARNKIYQTIWHMQRRGLLKKDAKGRLALTEKGHDRLAQYKLKTIRIKKPRRWDKKWRVVAFDVWESRKFKREALRKNLQRLGFIQLQASLWTHPYDCEEIIALLRTDLKLSPAIQYMVVDRIDRDQDLRDHFDLS